MLPIALTAASSLLPASRRSGGSHGVRKRIGKTVPMKAAGMVTSAISTTRRSSSPSTNVVAPAPHLPRKPGT